MANNPIAHKQLLYIGDAKFPVKTYINKDYIDIYGSVGKALDLVDKTVLNIRITDLDFAIAVASGHTPDENLSIGAGNCVEVFGCTNFKNAERIYYTCIFQDGVLLPDMYASIYSGTIIIVASEESLRRKKKDFKDYLNSWPDIEF